MLENFRNIELVTANTIFYHIPNTINKPVLNNKNYKISILGYFSVYPTICTYTLSTIEVFSME